MQGGGWSGRRRGTSQPSGGFVEGEKDVRRGAAVFQMIQDTTCTIAETCRGPAEGGEGELGEEGEGGVDLGKAGVPRHVGGGFGSVVGEGDAKGGGMGDNAKAFHRLGRRERGGGGDVPYREEARFVEVKVLAGG